MQTPQIAPLAGFTPLGFRPTTPAHLLGGAECLKGGMCAVTECAERTKVAPSGRWYITMGHAGFNSPANNRNGYASKASAETASKRYEAR